MNLSNKNECGPSQLESIWQQNKYGNGHEECAKAQDLRGIAGRDYELPRPKLPNMAHIKPSMGNKLSKVAEIFELDIIDEDEALKACKVIIQQHARSKGKTGNVENNT